jgi:chromosome partitioning protein
MNKYRAPTFTVQKMLTIFGSSVPRQTVINAENAGLIPKASRREGSVRVREWTLAEMPKLGARYGFLKRPENPVVISVFTTKGGVLKTTLAMNVARLAALHDIKTCVVGLDLQGDITTALGFEPDIDDSDDIESAMEMFDSMKGLAELIKRDGLTLDELILNTSLPTLDVIPETPELADLEMQVGISTRREYWLKENVTEPLKEKYDLIILDCSPNWNCLVTNALVASDVLLSPLECKINNFRNYKVFKQFTEKFYQQMKLKPERIFVPTRLTSIRKLSTSIRAWYMQNVNGCISGAIRESIQGEEAMAAEMSLPELAPNSIYAEEMREILSEIWSRVLTVGKRSTDMPSRVKVTHQSARSMSQASL